MIDDFPEIPVPDEADPPTPMDLDEESDSEGHEMPFTSAQVLFCFFLFFSD